MNLITVTFLLASIICFISSTIDAKKFNDYWIVIRNTNAPGTKMHVHCKYEDDRHDDLVKQYIEGGRSVIFQIQQHTGEGKISVVYCHAYYNRRHVQWEAFKNGRVLGGIGWELNDKGIHLHKFFDGPRFIGDFPRTEIIVKK